jgi:hypothetical protein
LKVGSKHAPSNLDKSSDINTAAPAAGKMKSPPPMMGLNPDEGFEETKKSKKKKKMQKLNPNLLGFQCNAAQESLNRDGGLESSADAPAKAKK